MILKNSSKSLDDQRLGVFARGVVGRLVREVAQSRIIYCRGWTSAVSVHQVAPQALSSFTKAKICLLRSV